MNKEENSMIIGLSNKQKVKLSWWWSRRNPGLDLWSHSILYWNDKDM